MIISDDSQISWLGEYRKIPGYFWLDLEEDDYALCLPITYHKYLDNEGNGDCCYVIIPKEVDLVEIKHDTVSKLKRASKTLEKYRHKVGSFDLKNALKDNNVFFSPLQFQSGLRWRRADK